MPQKTFDELAIANRRRDRLYFTMIPNVIWFFTLSASDFKLYNTIVKTTGPDGGSICFKTTETLAQESGLSMGAVSQSKANLSKAGLITIKARKRSKTGRPVDHVEIVDIWKENMLFFSEVYSPGEETRQFSSLGELKARVYSPGEPIGSPGETEEEPMNKIPPNEKERTDPLIRILSSSEPQTNRERILYALSETLQTPLPVDNFLYNRWEKGLDSIIANCRDVVGKKRLDDELTGQIIAAMRFGVENDEWAFANADYPNTAVIAAIPRLLREYLQEGEAIASRRAAIDEQTEQAQEVFAARQERAQRDLWDDILDQLKLQMTRVTFDAWLKNTTLLEQEDGRIVVGVPSLAAKEWLENRLNQVVARNLPEGIKTIEYEVFTGKKSN